MLFRPQLHAPSLLDVPISVFAHAQTNTPEAITTLRKIVSTSYYRPQIEAIRAELDDAKKQQELKKQLRAIAPVALLHHRKAATGFADKIAQQWPLLMGDVDQKDNPGLDMGELKHHLCRLPFVLLCAYSVRGGLWFVIRLPDHQTPETLAAHFRYVQKLFNESYGINLDASKGGNPCHLRYVSYDPAPYVNETPLVLSKTYTLSAQRPRPLEQTSRFELDERQLLERLVCFIESAGAGERHAKLLRASVVAGGHIAAGHLTEQTAVYVLENAVANWPMFSKSQRTIKDGIRYGQTKPMLSR